MYNVVPDNTPNGGKSYLSFRIVTVIPCPIATPNVVRDVVLNIKGFHFALVSWNLLIRFLATARKQNR